MTLSRLCLANIGRSRRRYGAFVFSSVFAVLVFYLFASLAMHPDVTGGRIAQRAAVLRGMAVCEGIIVVFSFFFLLYSSSSFLRARKKELGLLTLMGATKRQLRRMLIGEHVAIGVISVGLGTGLGTILFKYLLLAMARYMQVTNPIRFRVVIPALILTAVVFLGLFLVIGALTAIFVNPRKVLGLLRAHQKPKMLPRSSLWASALSLALILGGYLVAWGVDDQNLILAMLPVTAVVSLGTYLFFTQSTVAALRCLQGREAFSYRGTNLLTTGDLVFRMKENARVLASVAILSAGVMTVMGTIYTAGATMVQDYGVNYPHAVTFGVRGEDAATRLSDLAQGIFADEGVEVETEVALTGTLAGYGQETSRQTLVISESEYNAWARDNGYEQATLGPGEALDLRPSRYRAPGTGEAAVTLYVQGVHLELATRDREFLNTNRLYSIRRLMVIDDQDYSRIQPEDGSSDRIAFLSYELKDWKKAVKAGAKLEEALASEQVMDISSRLSMYAQRVQMTALTAFIALFITALFFISSGSVLYFRVFSEVDQDREKYAMMRKIGVTAREMGQVITRQIAVLFFAPFVIGAAHCSFALKALSNVVSRGPWASVGVWKYGLTAGGIFLVLHVVYFGFARHTYFHEVATPTRSAE